MTYDKAVILLTWSTIPTLQPMTSWCSFHSLQLATHASTSYSSHQTKIFDDFCVLHRQPKPVTQETKWPV